jgi:hypothetical protein
MIDPALTAKSVIAGNVIAHKKTPRYLWGSFSIGRSWALLRRGLSLYEQIQLNLVYPIGSIKARLLHGADVDFRWFFGMQILRAALVVSVEWPTLS